VPVDSRRVVFVLLLFGLACASPALAAPGDLDSAFSDDGRLATNMLRGEEALNDVAIQADGKIVVVGWAGLASRFAIARYDSNGTLDASFSADGKLLMGFGRRDAVALAVAIQGDGKIVVAGRAGGLFALARYRANGALDRTFSANGKQQTDVGVGSNVAFDLVIQPDGRIVLGGRTGGGGGRFALVRYGPRGRLDPSFGGDGIATTNFSVHEDQVTALALQEDGKIVAAGETAFASEWGLARFNSDGTLDPSFSADGKVTTDFVAGEMDWPSGIALQEDGRIVVAGRAADLDGGFALARYETTGALDQSFDEDGRVTTNFGPDFEVAWDVAIQTDGRIVAAGDALGSFALARYGIDGGLDATFGGDGRVTTSVTGCCDIATAVAIQGDGRIVAAGTGSDFSRFAVARYLAE
jgi:uncharacterized delta-60 repeat protein